MEELGRPQRFHKPKIMGSNPISATRSGVVQRQDVALLRQLSGFESLRRSLDSLLEGEGSFMPGPPSYSNSPIIAVQMTDEDVVVRVAQAFGVTYVPSAIRSAKGAAPITRGFPANRPCGLCRRCGPGWENVDRRR